MTSSADLDAASKNTGDERGLVPTADSPSDEAYRDGESTPVTLPADRDAALRAALRRAIDAAIERGDRVRARQLLDVLMGNEGEEPPADETEPDNVIELAKRRGKRSS